MKYQDYMHPERVFIYERFIDLIWHEDYTFYSCWIHRAKEVFESKEDRVFYVKTASVKLRCLTPYQKIPIINLIIADNDRNEEEVI